MEVEKINMILCPMCGIKFAPQTGKICQACTIAKTDITIGVTKQSVINFCRFCHRYMRPPWIVCSRDSKELLALLLRKIRGLNKCKIINACFIWTEPHSKRIKIKLTIQKQQLNNTTIQQTFISEFQQLYMQCDDCKKQFTPHTWGAVVQVRQYVDHKKTFFLLEQLLLKHNLHDRVLKITQQENGIDFYYKTITHAERLIDFLHTVLPIVVKKSKQLTSQDFRNNLVHYKYTFIVQLPLVCRHDLVILPHKVAKNIGGCSRLLLCWKISQNMGFIDLDNFNYITMSPVQYQHYENQMQILPFNRYKSQFQILNCDTIHLKNQQKIKSTLNKLMNKMYYYNVTRSENWQNIEVKGILGNLNCGKAVQGYDLRYLCYSENLQELKGFQQIILVRTTRDRKQPRIFKLKKLQEEGVMVDEKESFPNRKKKNQSHKDEELQNFMDDLQQDANLRKGVKMYKNQNALKNMNADQLKQVLGELQLCQLITDMKIDPNHADNEKYLNQIDGVEELISKMQKVVIENQEENPQEQQQKPK